MIDEQKTAEILALLHAGISQGQVARRYRISQQMVSKLWRRANGMKRGKRGGDRVSDRYRKSVERRRQQRKGQNGTRT